MGTINEEIKALGAELLKKIDNTYLESPEKKKAQTKLEEALYWLKRAKKKEIE